MCGPRGSVLDGASPLRFRPASVAKAPEDWRTPKPGGASNSSWKAPSALRPCIGTMNRLVLVLVLVLVLEDKPPNRGRGRERRRGRTDGSWKENSRREVRRITSLLAGAVLF